MVVSMIGLAQLALSLSKGSSSFLPKEGQGFDRLGSNGISL
jgi:hypothetical protein